MKLRLPISAAVLAVLATAATAADTPHGIDLTAIDKSVKPGDDFYAYANGAWLKRTEIPADQSRLGLLQHPQSGSPEAHPRPDRGRGQEPARRVRRRARSATSIPASWTRRRIEAKGIAPLKPQLDAIAAIADKKALARAIGESLRADVDPLNNTNFNTENLFGIWVAPGFSDSDHYTPYLLQGGLGIPSPRLLSGHQRQDEGGAGGL